MVFLMKKMNKEQILHKLNSYNKNTLMESLEIDFVDVGVEDEFLKVKMPVTSKVHQPFGILHGGASAALAETVGSAASLFFLNDSSKIIKGVELNINHLKSKREGEVYATARPIHKGKTTHLWEVKITDEEENLISICKLTNIVLDKK